MQKQRMRSDWAKVSEQIQRVILNKEKEIEMCLVAILSKGHVLIEDIPGVGKTTLAQALARSLGMTFHRIQFTSDLLPADVIGTSIFDEQSGAFRFFAGPLFSQFILADELNRANPRTQSAFLQAMEEGEVSVEGKAQALPSPFHVIATQNPQKQIGTFPLPESQLDRFLLCIELSHADRQAELRLIQGYDPRGELKKLDHVVTLSELQESQSAVEKVKVPQVTAEYIADILESGRKAGVALSIRAGMALSRSARAYAWLRERDFVQPEDVKAVAVSVLGHRLGGQQGVKYGRVQVEKLLSTVPVPI